MKVPKTWISFLFDGECCFDVKEEMHSRNEQKDPGCLLLRRSY